MTLTDPAARACRSDAPKVEAGDQKVLIVPIAKALAAGDYMVHWHAVSVDTHHTQGTFDFTVKP